MIGMYNFEHLFLTPIITEPYNYPNFLDNCIIDNLPAGHV